ncbi:hypothetical protein, partial [Actinoplanes philippinensis]|uniref:hypothetical protein n=1 Tax=Actinoplanes philippinensis TaxID=35752 RepID=UPI0033EFEB04
MIDGRRPTRRGDLPLTESRRSRDSAGAVLRAVLDHGPIARSSAPGRPVPPPRTVLCAGTRGRRPVCREALRFAAAD